MTKPNTELSTKDFDYHLPDHLIARYPLEKRSNARLLVVADPLQDRQFFELPDLLSPSDLLIFNDTKVMKARLFGKKDTGGAVELLVERLIDDPALGQNNGQHLALCHIKASRAPKQGQKLTIQDAFDVCVMGRQDNLFVVAFEQPILPLLEQYGTLPLPPYFDRSAEQSDDTRYQTVFYDPNQQKSVAAPTASLHFDDELLACLAKKGIQHAFVTLHVGAGTFAPVKTDALSGHIMHKEYAHLPKTTADKINAAKANGGKIIAVGTTVTRVLETAYLHAKDGKLCEFNGDTNIFIYPPYLFGVVDRLITNFHLPKSTLLMLVSAFSGTDIIKNAYRYAIEQNYRFFSYGDAMLLDKKA